MQTVIASCSTTRTGRLIFMLAILISIFGWGQVKSPVIGSRAEAGPAQILIDPSDPAIHEVTVNEGNFLQLSPRVIDIAGNVIDNAPLTFSSLIPDIPTVDASGNIQGRNAGFSTLTVSSGGVMATVTITVVKINSGISGFE